MDMGGFSISRSSQIQLIAVIAIYLVVVIGLGFYTKYQSKKASDGGGLASFLTGGGSLGLFGVAMLFLTNTMAGGTMVSGPAATYSIGYIYTFCVYGGFISGFSSMGACGKKLAIMGKRLNAQTIIQLLHHRYQSKKFAATVAISVFVFGVVLASAQLSMAAKQVAMLTGTSDYTFALILVAAITIIYSLSGGVKSLAKVAVVQGVVMLSGVIALFFMSYGRVFQEYGSIQAGMEAIMAANPSMLQAQTYTPLTALGVLLLSNWLSFASPGIVQGNLTYSSPKTYSRAIILNIICMTGIFGVMAGSGPIGYLLNPNLKQADTLVLYFSTGILPGVLGGLLMSGALAAIQSTVASTLIVSAAAIAKDMYQDCFNKKASDKTVSRLNSILLVLGFVLAALVALHPMPLTQLLNNFAFVGLCIGFAIPLLFGLYWKKATAAGALWSAVGGMAMFILGYVLNTYKPEIWTKFTFGAHPLIPALIVSLILMVVISPMTKKVPKGILRVWFSSDYDEKFAKEYDL